MSKEEDVVHDAVERLEWDERKEEESPFKKMRQLTRRTALTGGAAGIGALILQACGGSSSSSSSGGGSSSSTTATGTASAATGGSAAAGIFGATKSYKFTLVNHVTTNPFFTPTQNGAADACKLLGCSYQWTGSQNSNVGEMVSAFNSAVSAGVDGIGIALVDLHAFNGPTTKALAAKIPVVSYNADAAGNARLAYIGQDLFVSGQEMGQHIVELVPSGDVALFIATPGSLNIQPRIDGAQATLKSHPGIKTHVVATGAALPQELSTIDSYATAHPSTKGYFAVDGGSTQSIAQVIKKHNLRSQGIKGGGYDLTPITQQLLADAQIDFTIDQQPYLQGFLPILQLYMYQVSQTLTGPADVNTGLKFLDKTTVAPYNSTKSRYEGTSSSAGVSKS
ncbi:MAG TPA: sugar ABC transporter substrate-binding protein [Solirubrobacteraceae bacterium]|nr:sugar ABC transporter substrate-binding protein [Solirubrobacteraceae bacterium]